MSKRRVVVTGLGILSPVGNDIATGWQNIIAGKSGVKLITDFDTTEHRTNFAATVIGFDATKYQDAKEAKKCDLFIQYGIYSACQAVEDSGINDYSELNKDKVGVIMGSGIGGLQTIEDSKVVEQAKGPKRISPFFIPSSIVNMTSGYVAIRYNFAGPNLAVATACTTGTHSIGLAARTIAYGDADVMVAGGSEKASTPLGLGGFSSIKALSARNDSPETASRPWDETRDGFVLGDGAGTLVLEEYEHAKKRGAKIYCELVGFGMSDDAYHITRSAPGGEGAYKAMNFALKDANIAPEEVDYINAHATSTPAGDVEEIRAIKKLFANNLDNVLVSSTKSMTGHLLGAAGAIEAIYSVLALQDNIAPPTINLHQPDAAAAGVDLVPNTAKEKQMQVVLSNSFGFGGTNGALVFRKI